MRGAPESKAGAAALMVLGAIVAIACASAIGAVATLVFIALDQPAPARSVTLAGGASIAGPFNARVAGTIELPQTGGCAVVAWKSGMIYCLRNKSSEANIQAQAEKSGR